MKIINRFWIGLLGLVMVAAVLTAGLSAAAPASKAFADATCNGNDQLIAGSCVTSPVNGACQSPSTANPYASDQCLYPPNGTACRAGYYALTSNTCALSSPSNGSCAANDTPQKDTNGKVLACFYNQDGSQVDSALTQPPDPCEQESKGPGSVAPNSGSSFGGSFGPGSQNDPTCACTAGSDGSLTCTNETGGNGHSTDFAHVTDPAISANKCADISKASKCDLISNYVNPLVNFMAALAGVVIVISIVIGGIQYGSSAGDSSKASAAKNRIRNALVALVVFGLLYALLQFIVVGGIS